MKKELLTDALLREFLLGKVDDAERERIENLFVTDSEARERVLIVEQELIEDYLEDNLTTADKEKFLLQHGQTSAQQQQLRISKAIKDWALKENARSRSDAVGVSGWSRLRTKLWLKPVFMIPIAVTTIVAIVCVAVWVNSRMTRSAIAQELAQLNAPASLRETPTQMAVFNLSPITTRGMETRAVFKRSAENGIVELRMPWVQKERYSTYQAEVRRVDGGDSFTIPNLQAGNDGGSTIRLRLPVRILSRGQYQIRLSGVTADGVGSLSEEYPFTVDV